MPASNLQPPSSFQLLFICTVFKMTFRMRQFTTLAFLVLCQSGCLAFAPYPSLTHPPSNKNRQYSAQIALTILEAGKKDIQGSEISQKRRNQLGIPDDAREYDLDEALNQNTDPLITKIIAGSFIIVVIGLLVAGIVIPSVTDYGEGVCSPIQNGGRC